MFNKLFVLWFKHQAKKFRFRESGNLDREIGRLFAKALGSMVWDEVKEPEEFPRLMQCYAITDIWFDPTTCKVNIKTMRPGVIIGIRGENINRIEEKFRKFAREEFIPFAGIHLVEDKDPLVDSLYHCYNSYHFNY